MLAEASMSHGASKSSEVLYITMALIGLLAVCVFVIAGLVLVVSKRRRKAGALFCLMYYSLVKF